jgi:NADH-quinone oxidoreductase subunit C
VSEDTKQPDEAAEAAEEAVAEAIEEAVGDAPVSIEEEQMLEAAEVEKLEAGEAHAEQAAAPSYPIPDDPVLAALATSFPSCEFRSFEPPGGPAQDIVLVPPAVYAEFMQTVYDAGFDTFVGLCGVDYLRRRPRFEVVVNVLSMERRSRLRVRVGLPGDDPVLSSLVPVYPGANFYERETYDLFGIVFDGHPDLTRILLPDDWEGYPLRKDYAVGSVPVQFKEAYKAT